MAIAEVKRHATSADLGLILVVIFIHNPLLESYGNQEPSVEPPKDIRDKVAWLFSIERCQTIALTTMFRAFLCGRFAQPRPPHMSRPASLIPSYAQRSATRWAVRFAIAKDIAGRTYRWFAG